MVTRSHASDSDASYVLVPGGNSAGGAVPAAPTEQSPPLAEPPTTEPMEGALQASHESLSEAAATVEGTEPTAVTIGLPSLSSQLMGSEFGNFTQESSAPINHTCWFTAISVLEESIGNLPPLPQIVVIGDECAGKSSLLESITKCSVFPRDERVCTRMPIRLRLTQTRNEDDKIVVSCEGHPPQELESRDLILGAVKDLMDAEAPPTGVPGAAPQYSEKEIVISISGTEVPTLQCIDLPGIRQDTSTGAREITEGIVQNYLEKQCIILCVIEGDKGSLSTVRALAMVKEWNRSKDTFLVFTKADEVVPRNVKRYIVDRILGTSADPELLGTTFAGRFAVVNRCTRWEVSLDAATAFERAEFEGIIFKNEYVFKSETLPEGCYLVEFKRRIGERITIPNLLKCLDAQFNKYIVEEWVPRAQSVLVQETGRVQRQRLDLGSPADELGIEAVMKELHRQMNSRDILSSAMLDIGAHVLLALKEAAGRDPVPPGSETATPSDWGSLAWARGSELQATSDRRACLDAATGDLYLAPLLWAVKKAFNAPGSETYINLPRFETLRALLVDEVVPELYRAAMLPVGEYAARAAAALVDASYALAATPEDSYRALEKGLTGCIIRHLVDLVDNKLALGAGLPGDFRLKEDTWHAQRRVELNEQLVKLREAKKKIDRIQLQ